MKAVLVHRPGGPEALDYVEVPVPALGARDVLIRAQAFGVGQPDKLIRSGVYKWMPPLPANPGNDVAGYVDAVGADVTEVSAGQRVLLSARDLAQRGGCYAEYVAAPADAVHLLPENVAFEDAVCLANYQVAWALLHHCGAATPPRSVLVIGAAGGVGTSLVQLAKIAGMKVIGTVSTPEKAAFARRMGADETIFYRDEDVIARTRALTDGRGVSLVLDHVCGPEFYSYLGALDKWGTIVSYNAFAGLPAENAMREMRKYLDICPAIRCFSFHIYDHDREGRREIMRKVISYLAEGAIRPSIFKRFKLSDVRAAHELLDSGAAFGKIVMTPD
ncbi:quinone oxidoreductase [Bradyrhizobium sp. CCBAU 051011]|uniref:zinc-dependent alcohol dehydrogenase family protein n=1 Tax=Bradyrhizobium sp. CCBAU 051011 TaxID=858422 RepID=UPI0013742D52|nr:zinc-dependent alcohol dehydrogenase family protein [Bradyrhizobium sp. CCBAU 051011]QHO71704.1 quinone oxidoreductase [Bradyrhizobium sp. CCBAU 051011]